MAQRDATWQTQKPKWVQVNVLALPHAPQAAAWQQTGFLDVGEAEAIALARQLTADWLLTDDAAARVFAQLLGVEVHGSLGIVLWAAAVGHLQRGDAEATLDRLEQSSLWISAAVLEEAKAALDKLFTQRSLE
ncbi:DUF3368 domain-containing protein [Candidatus Hakubella thermalkaliphila]|nr:DUF3368 domain-containing protein [Candidatus Hakubella thermalkaliphila]